MRRVLLLAALAVFAVVAIGATASARSETNFSVIALRGHGHRVGSNSFLVHGRLAQVGDTDDIVGRYAAKFTRLGNHRQRIRAVARFFGEGTLKAKGVGGRGSRIPIIGGTGAFNGAAGKLKTHNIGHGNTLLNFHFVQ